MRKISLAGIILVMIFSISACGGKSKEAVVPAQAEDSLQIKVDVMNSKGDNIGTALLTQVSNGVKIKVDVSGLKPGKHGIHFHENAACEPPDFKSAGEHFNPEGKKHGLMNPEGPHAGDLPNLEVGSNGKGKMEVVDPRVTLESGKTNSLLKPGGTALIIHEGPDDQITDPTGNSGGRVACGLITMKMKK